MSGNSCGITNTLIYPPIVTTVSFFVEIHCDYDDNLEFNSFYTPSGETLTSSNEPKYVISNSGSSAILIVKNIEESDAGEYLCNFRSQNNQECQEDIEVQLTPIPEFCTPSFVTYHAYIGDNATLKCCVENYNTWTWSTEGQEIDESDHFSFDRTDLQIHPVVLGDEGIYTCTAEMNGIPVTIKAQLEVYCKSVCVTLSLSVLLFQLKYEPTSFLPPSIASFLAPSLAPPPLSPHTPLIVQLSVTMNPAQLVVNASEMAVLTCVAHAYPLPNILWSRETGSLQLMDGVVEKEVGQWHHFCDCSIPLTVCRGEEKCMHVCASPSHPLPPSLPPSLPLPSPSFLPFLSLPLPPSFLTPEIINTTTIQSTLTLFNVQDEDTGTYRCTAANVIISRYATASLQLFGESYTCELGVLISGCSD